jgi:hypothetical protein
VGPKAGLDACEKCRPHRDSFPGPSNPYSVAIQTELPSKEAQRFGIKFVVCVILRYIGQGAVQFGCVLW